MQPWLCLLHTARSITINVDQTSFTRDQQPVKVTVKNTGTVATKGWKVTWSWPGNQQISSGWSATVTQSGAAVTATSLSYNSTLAPGASTSFGFQATYSGSNSAPTLTCTVT